MSIRGVAGALAVAAALCARTASASDGVTEINAARAAAGGVTPGDIAGFPVTLSAPGSYRLTGDLVVPDENTTAIAITAPNVTLDLGGFAISGPTSCAAFACAPTGVGVGVIGSADGSTVRNGRVTGMGLHGISLLARARVEDVDVGSNGGSGISVTQGSVRRSSAIGNGDNGFNLAEGSLEDSAAIGNATLGAALGANASYARNTLTGNASTSVLGGHATAGNVCSDRACSVSGARRFYLSPVPVDGANASTACTTGFHMASLWEVHDPSALFYDPVNGQTAGDAGQGPPSGYVAAGGGFFGAPGWIRTGYSNFSVGIAGLANCSGWSTASPMLYGSAVVLDAGWEAAAFRVSPWQTQRMSCNSPIAVWCVED
jgi:hypothetical protein